MTSAGGPTNSTPKRSGNAALRRYAPLIVVVVVIAVVVAIAGLRGNNNDNKNKVSTNNTTGSASTLPITFQQAKAEGKNIDFGPKCDPKTGRVAIPLITAVQCVEPWPAGKDNGGATSPGVTRDTIKVVVYVGQNDPLQQALVASAGASTNPTDYYNTDVGYLEGFAKYYETYGRKLEIVRVNATGGPADHAAALADAAKITKEIKPFAVINGPIQAPEYWRQIAKAHILCIAECVTASSESETRPYEPYVWSATITPEQYDDLLAEFVGKQLAGKDATFAGDAKMHTEKRVYGWIQAELTPGQYKARLARLFKEFKDKYGITIAAEQTYLYDPSQAQNIARTVIAKMKSKGVTTIFVSADPLIPANYTQEATAQNYFPEWVIAPSVYVDTTVFGRTYDQRQWAHAIGISVLPARGPRVETNSYQLYKWFTGKKTPPINDQGIPYARAALFMTGVHLAGPDLTPETFKEGMFRYLPAGSSPVRPYTSYGTKLWGRPDYAAIDDVNIIWWDPNAQGESETGIQGKGLYRLINAGNRYLPGKIPSTPITFFDPANTITVLAHNPASDTPPSYPPPAG
jgi:hypothetical protein